MQKIKVTFSRVYEIDLSVIHYTLAASGYEDVEMTEELIKERAEEVARNEFGSEFEFLNESKDNFSSKIEII